MKMQIGSWKNITRGQRVEPVFVVFTWGDLKVSECRLIPIPKDVNIRAPLILDEDQAKELASILGLVCRENPVRK